MGFLTPWFLAGLAAVSVPVFVHLLRRQTTTPRPFSSLMFFERGVQSSTRHRRLRHLILFSLRTALVVLFVLTFANPFLRRANAGAEGRLLLVVVDNSYSMRSGKPQSQLEKAKQAAMTVLASRPPGQRAQIMSLGSQLQVLMQPSRDRDALTAAVQGISQSDSHGNFGELGRGIRAYAETLHTPVELHLFSDMQRSNVPANFANMVLPDNFKIVLHSTLDQSRPAEANWAVEGVEAPAELAGAKDDKRSLVKAMIAGYNTPLASRSVSLVVEGRTIAKRQVNVPPSGRATVQFDSLEVPYGFNRCQVSIDSADDFPGDDTALFAVRRADPQRVLFVHEPGDIRSPLYFGSAIQAAGQSSFIVQTLRSEQTSDIDPSRFAYVVLSDALSLPSLFENALGRYVQNGGGVLIALGTSAGHRSRIPFFGGAVSGNRISAREGIFGRIGNTDSTHPAMQGTNSGEDLASGGGDWSDSRFFYVASVDPANARVIIRLSDGTPLLLDKQIGEGRVLLLASGLDNVSNDMPLHPAFVPFVDRVSRYLSGNDQLSGSRVVDSFVQVRTTNAPPDSQSKGVEIIDPEGHRPVSLSEASTIRSYQLRQAGFYHIHFANGRETLVAVNPDRLESDLATIPSDILALWSGNSAIAPTSSAVPAVPAEPRGQISFRLWWYVMLFALATAVAESILASFYLGTQREDA